MKSYLKIVFGLLGVAIVWLGGLTPARADDGWDRSIKGLAEYSDVHAQLQMLVNVVGFSEINKFCIVAGSDNPYPGAEVYWPTENKLILWEPQDNQAALLDSRDYVDLNHDVVPSENDITLKYMVLPWTRPEVDQVLRDCARYGDNYTIRKSEGGWVPIQNYPRFSSVQTQLQTLVDAQSKRAINEFYVIGQQDGSFLAAYVYWPAQDRLILWIPDPHDFAEPHGLTDSSFSDVDLKHQAVDKEIYYRATDQMPRAYAYRVVHACLTLGSEFTIKRSK